MVGMDKFSPSDKWKNLLTLSENQAMENHKEHITDTSPNKLENDPIMLLLVNSVTR